MAWAEPGVRPDLPPELEEFVDELMRGHWHNELLFLVGNNVKTGLQQGQTGSKG